MQGFWLTLGWGLAALLAASVLVTLVELLRQGAGRAFPPPPSQPAAVRVDLDVDELHGDRVPAEVVADPEARRAALAEVLHRLQQPGSDPPWVETSPSVLTPKASADLERR